jgi:hypothetical protein
MIVVGRLRTTATAAAAGASGDAARVASSVDGSGRATSADASSRTTDYSRACEAARGTPDEKYYRMHKSFHALDARLLGEQDRAPIVNYHGHIHAGPFAYPIAGVTYCNVALDILTCGPREGAAQPRTWRGSLAGDDSDGWVEASTNKCCGSQYSRGASRPHGQLEQGWRIEKSGSGRRPRCHATGPPPRRC